MDSLSGQTHDEKRECTQAAQHRWEKTQPFPLIIELQDFKPFLIYPAQLKLTFQHSAYNVNSPEEAEQFLCSIQAPTASSPLASASFLVALASDGQHRDVERSSLKRNASQPQDWDLAMLHYHWCIRFSPYTYGLQPIANLLSFKPWGTGLLLRPGGLLPCM